MPRALPPSRFKTAFDDSPDCFLGVPILDCERPDVCAVVFLYDGLVDSVGVKEAGREADLLSPEHPIDLHRRIDTQFLAELVENVAGALNIAGGT